MQLIAQQGNAWGVYDNRGWGHVVPEPAAYGAVLVAIVLVFWLRRRFSK